MLRAPLLTAVAALVVFAATAPAQTPATTTPDLVATTPTEEIVTTTTYTTWYQNPIVMWGTPVAAVLAITVIGLFVVRWRRTGEIPGPPVAP